MLSISQQLPIQMLKYIILACLISTLLTQSCLKADGEAVKWWVILKVPQKTARIGYGYYDSTMKTGQFIYYDAKVDVGITPLTKTTEQINTKNLDHVAWNDQKPSGQITSSHAHAKGLIAYDLASSQGFFIDHSLPKYPAFSNGKINPTIPEGQNVYGQHLSCFSLTLKELEDISSYILITWPFIYEGKIINSTATQSLYKLSKSMFSKLENQFHKHDLRSVYGYTMKTIYKNDKVNGSIFEDGLTSYLTVSPIIAQTWGRPTQKAWCSQTYQVFNALSINLNGITWNKPDDHSKWIIGGNDFACYGDMNRMESQWTRGGSFFCLMQPTLIAAMKSLIVSHDSC